MKQLLIIGMVWPEPESTGAGQRMMQLIDLFLDEGYTITFASTALKTPHSQSLTELGVTETTIVLNCDSFDAFVSELQPHVVLFDRFMSEEQFGWRVADQCPKAIRILDTEDLHCLRKERQLAFKQNKDFSINSLLLSELAKREIASIYRCDLSLMISTYEMEVLQSLFQIDKSLIHYLPFVYGDAELTRDYKSYNERSHFVTIGNFLHEPNWDAVRYLKETIWPLIRARLPQAEMHVYGSYATDKVTQLHQPKDGFLIKGRASNTLETLVHYKVCLAPLRFGAGLKTKLVEAMLTGTPNVTTTIGAEGFPVALDWSGAIVNDAETFADEAVSLYTNQTAWKVAQQNGRLLLNQAFSKSQQQKVFKDRFEDLVSNLGAHRQRNFIGAMLQHHTMRSTKFMAKWIELKNK